MFTVNLSLVDHILSELVCKHYQVSSHVSCTLVDMSLQANEQSVA